MTVNSPPRAQDLNGRTNINSCACPGSAECPEETEPGQACLSGWDPNWAWREELSSGL